MPIGVPKVEYRLPGESEADWIDLYNCLYRERMLFLCQDLGDEVANQLISLMLYLNAEDPSQAFFMYINSLGGSVTCGIGIYDIMRYLESGITTICMGTASSMASFVLAGGTYGRRLSLPHGRIMIHQPEGGSDGQASEILSESTEVNRIRKQIGLIYATRTQQSIERIACDLDRDQFMSAEEARAYGLIDYIAKTADDATVIDINVLGLLAPSSTAPKAFKALAASQTMEETAEAIRGLPVADIDEKVLVGASQSNAPIPLVLNAEQADGVWTIPRIEISDEELVTMVKLQGAKGIPSDDPLALPVLVSAVNSSSMNGNGAATSTPPDRRSAITIQLNGTSKLRKDSFEQQVFDNLADRPKRYPPQGSKVERARAPDDIPITKVAWPTESKASAQPSTYAAADMTSVVAIPDPVTTLPPAILNRLESFMSAGASLNDAIPVSATDLDAVLNNLDMFEIELPTLEQRGGTVKRQKPDVEPSDSPRVEDISIDRRAGRTKRRRSF